MSISKRAWLAALLVVGATAQAAALEFGVDAIASNLQFPWEADAPIADSTFPKDNYFWGGAAWLRSPLGEDAAIRVSVERDPVLRNSALAAVEFERGVAKISAGPFFGFLNSDSAPFSAGISAAVRLQWPGVAYVSMRSDGATAISLFQADAAPQARTEIAAGFYVPHAIVSGVVSAKRFNETDEAGYLITDSLTRYAMEVEIFKKNVPYTLLASAGYEQRSKRFEASDTTDTLGAIVFGVETAAQIGPALDIKTSFATGVYLFGLDALAGRGPSGDDLFFRAGLGFSLDVAAIPPRPPKVEAPAAAPPQEAPAEEAEPEEKAAFSRLALAAGGGIGYERLIYLPSELALVETIANSRATAWFDIGYRLTPMISLGAEVGLGYFTFKDETSGDSYNIFDVPMRLVAGFKLGGIRLDAFGGALAYGLYTSGIDPLTVFGIEAGARARLGWYYLEGSYLFGLDPSAGGGAYGFGVNSSFLRFGTGVVFNIM